MFVDVPGIRLQVQIEGRGVPCIVPGATTFYQRTFSARLREHLQLIFVDLRDWLLRGLTNP